MISWLLVAGDLTTLGGMDRANYELAWHLAERGDEVHIVAHQIAAPLVDHERVIAHLVPRPLGYGTLAGPLLASRARTLARTLTRRNTRVVVNGGNCCWPDINWVHAVHAAWPNRTARAPAAARLHAAIKKRSAIWTERQSVRAARLVIANSERARGQVISKVGVAANKVHVVYYGIDRSVFRPATPKEKEAARRQLELPVGVPLVCFIGVLGHDRSKGFDVLFEAWKRLCADPRWDAVLVAAGGGSEVDLWEKAAVKARLTDRVRMLGFTRQVPLLVTAADVMVHPTHYDAYGLSVQEALCCGLPVLVTATAGVAERYPAVLRILLLTFPPQAQQIADLLRAWRADMRGYSAAVAPFAAALRQHSWADMARDIVDLAVSGEGTTRAAH